MIFRRAIGWCVAEAYRLAGTRKRRLEELRGKILPIVFHAAKAEEVRSVLAWLKRAGALECAELSFDDGWTEFKGALAVLEEFDKRATLFIAPGETIRGRVWTDGTTVPERRALYGLAAAERYTKLEEWGVATERHLMTESEVREVARHPLVRIGNHTWSHLSATSRPLAEVIAEVKRAQATLVKWCGYAPTDFAYPFGRGSKELDAAIRALGLSPHYTRQGFVTRETRGSARNMVYEGMTLAENIGRVLAAWPKVGETL